MSAAEASKATEQALERFLEVALKELSGVAARLDRAAIAQAVALIRKSQQDGGRVHVTGIGKPEHVARYAASLLASTGTPSTFLHGTEATHGSIGQVVAGDVVIAISNSGRTPELLSIAAVLREFGAKLIAVTGDTRSSLAGCADLVLEARVSDEGGPLKLAPRTSFLAEALVLAALSVALQQAQGFTREDYSRRHPAGALGEKSRRRD